MLLLSPYYGLCHFDAWAEDCSNSIANVLELLQSIDFFVKKKPNLKKKKKFLEGGASSPKSAISGLNTVS